ncbi:nucleoside phosphatase [Paraglaciecola mesophila]|uniref:nucleoside phosphatase n=1 Tax=Paraglaciecola mesophila TaxID=197222 RepID=UPI001362949D|nr:nucleoside phosphatase [Paraglaciecola mesophila]
MPVVTAKNVCHIIYDAGSSGTRLFIYEQTGTNLITHSGPKVGALADPLRGVTDSHITDIDSIVGRVISSLDLMRRDGERYNGEPEWLGFDWVNQCNIASAKIYATAGMRIAEQSNPEGSLAMWQALGLKLAAKVGPEVLVETKTISGFEEGLFAWLSLQDTGGTTDFGMVEMGGASSQVTFPCPDCSPTNDAVKKVRVNGKPIQIYSYSYLGLGQDEAPKSLTFPAIDPVPPNCAFGVGDGLKDWSVARCADEILLTVKGASSALKDPYNYSSSITQGAKGTDGIKEGQKIRGTTNTLPNSLKNISKWTLTGAFNYRKETDINECCFNKSSACYKPQSACFTPIYLDKYLQTLDIPLARTTTKEESWTRGAVQCEIENCLAEVATPPVCRWMASGCLQH